LEKAYFFKKVYNVIELLSFKMICHVWGSISYAVKAPDISPMKTEDLERPTLGPTQAGGSEAENNMCMCVL
jgi:hypothetical protein